MTHSFFKTLIDHEVTVELKNDVQIRGTLKSVDQYLNIKLDEIQVVEELKYPHLVRDVCFLHFLCSTHLPVVSHTFAPIPSLVHLMFSSSPTIFR